jgi:hypothetical protein
MPTRILREGILTSEAINRLSDKAELFYRRLMSAADDYGRFYAHPSLLRAACYPLKIDSVTEANVKQWLAECIKQSLIVLYGDGKYVQVVKFRQQTRSRSKFPEPTDSELLINGESGVKHLRASSAPAPPTPSTTTPSPNGAENRFKIPSFDEVKFLMEKSGLPESEAEKFINYYGSNGWRVGKNPMRSVSHAVGMWKSRYDENRYLRREKRTNQI